MLKRLVVFAPLLISALAAQAPARIATQAVWDGRVQADRSFSGARPLTPEVMEFANELKQLNESRVCEIFDGLKGPFESKDKTSYLIVHRAEGDEKSSLALGEPEKLKRLPPAESALPFISLLGTVDADKDGLQEVLLANYEDSSKGATGRIMLVSLKDGVVKVLNTNLATFTYNRARQVVPEIRFDGQHFSITYWSRTDSNWARLKGDPSTPQ
jgi:hypothetical protein